MYKNPYYNPENLGLEIVAELEMSEPCYSYDTVVVWREVGTENYFWAHDAGCSCPTPFEQYTDKSLLTRLYNQQSYDELVSYVKTCYKPDYKRDFLKKIRELGVK